MTSLANRPHAAAPLPPEAVRDNPQAAKLAFEVALKYFTPEELQTQFGLTEEQYALVVRDPTFTRAVQAYRREIDTEGQDFKIKARKLAFVLLSDLASLATDPTVDPKDRIDAIREIGRFAGYGMKDAADQPAGPAFQLLINMPQSPVAPGAVGPITIDQPPGPSL